MKIGIFGYFSRDEENESSDIDSIVEFEPNTRHLSEKKLKNLSQKSSIEMSICPERNISNHILEKPDTSISYICIKPQIDWEKNPRI